MKAKEEEERKAKEEEERKAKEEAERKAREEEERKAREEEERKAKEEAERKAKEEAERKAKEEEIRKAKNEEEEKKPNKKTETKKKVNENIIENQFQNELSLILAKENIESEPVISFNRPQLPTYTSIKYQSPKSNQPNPNKTQINLSEIIKNNESLILPELYDATKSSYFTECQKAFSQLKVVQKSLQLDLNDVIRDTPEVKKIYFLVAAFILNGIKGIQDQKLLFSTPFDLSFIFSNCSSFKLQESIKTLTAFSQMEVFVKHLLREECFGSFIRSIEIQGEEFFSHYKKSALIRFTKIRDFLVDSLSSVHIDCSHFDYPPEDTQKFIYQDIFTFVAFQSMLSLENLTDQDLDKISQAYSLVLQNHFIKKSSGFGFTSSSYDFVSFINDCVSLKNPKWLIPKGAAAQTFFSDRIKQNNLPDAISLISSNQSLIAKYFDEDAVFSDPYKTKIAYTAAQIICFKYQLSHQSIN